MARSKRERTEASRIFAEQLDILVKREEQKGKTQAEIANAIGISGSQLYDYRNDYRTPTIDTLKKVSDYFNVSVDQLLTGVKTKNRNTAKYTGLSDGSIEVLHSFSDSKSFTETISAVLSDLRFYEAIRKVIRARDINKKTAADRAADPEAFAAMNAFSESVQGVVESYALPMATFCTWKLPMG